MIILLWLILCVAVGIAAKNRDRSFLAFALLSAVISPIGGLIVLVVMGHKAPSVEESYKPSEPDIQEEVSSLASNYEASAAPKAFCPNCGAQIDADTKFCPSCGKQINA